MSDPKRWLEDRSVADSIEAKVLGAEAKLEPPAELLEQSFAQFAALVGLAPGAAEPELSAGNAGHAATAGQSAALSGATSAATATLGASVLKALAVGALFGTVTVTAAHYLGSAPDASPRPAASPALNAAPKVERGSEWRERAEQSSGALPKTTAPSSVTSAQPRAEEAREPIRAERSPRPGSPAAEPRPFSGDASRLGASPASSATAAGSSLGFPDEAPAGQGLAASAASGAVRSSALKAEAVELAQAKNLLEQGRAGEALSLVVAGSSRFANGVLADERELLTVQALSNLGRREEARRRAHSFLASHGEGSISLRMQRLLERL